MQYSTPEKQFYKSKNGSHVELNFIEFVDRNRAKDAIKTHKILSSSNSSKIKLCLSVMLKIKLQNQPQLIYL